ncbi:hypothetical protein [Dyella mobilis]|uniref:HEAT repeat domain-containing protein n=1 Tax=Dyella mobilis TaxID=1849582 RepID=A0ABS2KHP9_9GAMM|nr:hypothetical protein [Dyella mobilis]MBM7130676.1 hypothetical protein [Dyella mobilis]
MSTDWKRFFKFLGTQVDEEASEAPTFSPGDFLAKGLQFVRLSDGSDVAPIESVLESLPVEHLIDIDESLRSYYGTPFRDWPANAMAVIASSKMTSSMRQSLLFLAASHSNGRIREQVLELLPQFPGRLTLAASLIRCADWVPIVRDVAQKASVQLLDLCAGEDVAAIWPLAIRLKVRERLDREWFSSCVEGWMLRSESSQWLLSQFSAKNTKVRAWAYEKSLEANLSIGINLLDSAISDPNPRIALHALRYSAHRCDEGRAQSLAKRGLDAAHPIIRRESLRVLAALDASLPRETIHRMLRDKASGVRSLASFLLRERFSEQAIDYWRSVVDSDVQRPTMGALTSLVDKAEAEDVPRFKRWLDHPRGLVHTLCIRGIVKVDGQFSDAEFLRIVSTPSERLQRELAAIVRRGAIPLDLHRLMATLSADTATSHTRESLRGLLRELSHWDRLAMVLGVHPNGQVELLWFVTVLGDWLADSNCYAPLGPARRSSLLAVLEKRRDEIDDIAYSQIEQAILRH